MKEEKLQGGGGKMETKKKVTEDQDLWQHRDGSQLSKWQKRKINVETSL